MSDAFTKPTDSLDDWINGAKLPEKSETVYGRADLIAEVEELERQLQVAETQDDRLAGGSAPATIAQKIEAHKAEMELSARTFRFRALPKAEAKAINDAAPKDKDGEPDADYVARHFIAKAAVPAMTPEQVQSIRDRIGEGQFARLWTAAWGISNEGRLHVPFSPRASVILSRQNSSES